MDDRQGEEGYRAPARPQCDLASRALPPVTYLITLQGGNIPMFQQDTRIREASDLSEVTQLKNGGAGVGSGSTDFRALSHSRLWGYRQTTREPDLASPSPQESAWP